MTSTKNSLNQNSKKLSKTKSCKKRCTNKTEWRVEERYFCFCDPDCYKCLKIVVPITRPLAVFRNLKTIANSTGNVLNWAITGQTILR